MSQVFSPSRSLKYCRITLRTVSVSSFSPPPSDLASDLVLCCKRHLVVVFEPLRALRKLVEELRHRGELRLGGLEGIHAGAEHGGVTEPLRVPTDMLARDAHAALHAVESVQLVQVLDEHRADLVHVRRGELRARGQEMRDLAEDPGA